MALILIFILFQLELIAQSNGIKTVMTPIDGELLLGILIWGFIIDLAQLFANLSKNNKAQ